MSHTLAVHMSGLGGCFSVTCTLQQSAFFLSPCSLLATALQFQSYPAELTAAEEIILSPVLSILVIVDMDFA